MTSRRPTLDLISHSPDQTRQFGARLGSLAEPGDIILLAGSIGAGKTTLAQGIARGMGVEGYVQSPTFTLASEHTGRPRCGRSLMLYHLDLYRLEEAEDLTTFGYDEYLDSPDGVVVIEWPQRLPLDLFEAYLVVRLEYLADAKRSLTLVPRGDRYEALIEAFRAEVFGARRRPAAPSD